MTKLFLSMLAAMTLSACATVRPVADHPRAFVVRHFEKETGSDPALTATGSARAQTLAARLSNERIAAIFSTDTVRTRMSARPTAEQGSLVILVYEPGNMAALSTKVAEARGNVLIVGHSNTVPMIVSTLSGTPQPPIDESHYGDLFVVDLVTRQVTSERIGDAR